MITATCDMPEAAVERAVSARPSPRELELGAIIDSYNSVTEKLKASHDVLTTEIRRLHERLAEKDLELERRRRLSALGEMAAGVAHEVRNPLGGILLFATLLEKDLQERPELARRAAQIASASRSLEGVVGDILAFANPQAPRCGSVRVADVARDVIGLLRPRWEKLGCTVRLASVAPAALARGEADQIQRALLNVVSNGIDAAGRCGEVWVTVRDTHGTDSVTVSVSDNGPGVPAELKDRVFNPFFTSKDSGTGLGLAIVHGIVEAHGGEVRVSARDGGGAVFDLVFPRPEQSPLGAEERV